MMEETSPWKELIERGFQQEVEETKIMAEIPRERTGKFPSKEFDVIAHLKSCLPEEAIIGDGKIQGSPQKLELPPKILEGDYGDVMEFLGKREQGPIDFTTRAHEYPQSSVGLVVSRKKFSKNMALCIGSGFLIGPNVVMTCAHNVHQVNIKKDHENIQFIPAPIVREIKSREYQGKGFRIKKVIVPDQYRTMDRSQPDENNQGLLFDIAVLTLDTQLNLEEYFGSFSYNFDWDESPLAKSIEIMKGLKLIGFPRVGSVHQFHEFLFSAVSATNYMLYSLSTFPGTSGSPLLMAQKNEPYAVIAIHVLDMSHIVITNNKSTERKGALKLRSDMFQHLQQTEQHVKCFYNLKCKNIKAENVPQAMREIEIHQKKKQIYRPQIILDLWNNSIGVEGCRYIGLGEWENLTKLNLGGNHIGVEGCRYLSQGEWENLTTLILMENTIGDEGCKHLAQGKWKNLQTLSLGVNQIGVEGSRYLSQGKWEHLLTLNIGYNNLGNDGCQHLTQGKWECLQNIDLKANHVNTTGCKYLASVQYWRNSLKQLNLYGNQITKEVGQDCFKGLPWRINFVQKYWF